MIRRSTWVILALFAVSLLAVWYIRRDQADETVVEDTPVPTPQRLFSFDVGAVEGVGIQPSTGAGVVMVLQEDGTWRVTQPADGETNQSRVSSAISALQSLTILQAETQVPSLESIGLQPPEYRLTFTLNNGERHVLLVGKQTPIGSGYNVQLDSGPVMVVSRSGLASLLELPLNPPIDTPTPTPEAMLEDLITPQPTTAP